MVELVSRRGRGVGAAAGGRTWGHGWRAVDGTSVKRTGRGEAGWSGLVRAGAAEMMA